ncbi:MAG: PrsW family intramembrane metalloprotease [Chloroflexi bacterium]|nr:PrsW family intramembrane metalloprotease [Chloroflexota bacterium]
MGNDTLKTIGFVGMIVVGAASVFMPPVVVGLLALASAYNGTYLGDFTGLWAGLAGLSALLGGWFIVQGARGLRGRPSSPFRLARPWVWVALLALTVILIAATPSDAPAAGLMKVLAALLPGMALLAFVSRRLAGAHEPPTWRQVAAQVSAALTVSLGWSIFWEVLALVGLVLMVGIALALLPDGAQQMEQMGEQFSDPRFIASGEFLRQPAVLAFLLVLMAGFVPIIEEAGKLLAVGALALAHRPSRAQALAWGIAGGVTFSVYEAAFADPFSGAVASIAILRVGAMLIHASTAALTAWGLWEWLRRRRPGRFALGLTLAVALHSTWNVLAIVATALQTAAGSAWATGLMAAVFGLLSMGAGVVLALALEPSRLVHVLHIERGEDR